MMAGSPEADLKVVCVDDCGNAPRKKLLLEFSVAWARGDLHFIAQHIADQIHWERVGKETICGKDSFMKWLEQTNDCQVSEIVIDQIITHGSSASLNGTAAFGEKRCSFSNVYLFNSTSKHAKIKKITTYAIEV
jgi:hypothetical protein